MQFRTVCYLAVLGLLACHGKPSVMHRLERGQTLYQLAHVYGVTVEEILRSNRIEDVTNIPLGERILIPGAGFRRRVPKSVFEVKSVNRELQKSEKASRKIQKKESRKRSKKGPKGKILFHWPAKGKVISEYGMRNEKMHNGIDIRLEKGNSIHASAPGDVAYVGNDVEGYGNLVILRHGKKTFSIYAYLGEIKVKKGEKVKLDQKVAEVVGKKGGFFHFEIRRAKQALDPMRLLRGQALDEEG